MFLLFVRICQNQNRLFFGFCFSTKCRATNFNTSTWKKSAGTWKRPGLASGAIRANTCSAADLFALYKSTHYYEQFWFRPLRFQLSHPFSKRLVSCLNEDVTLNSWHFTATTDVWRIWWGSNVFCIKSVTEVWFEVVVSS